MNLSDAQIDWFARQIVVPGIGAAGQTQLVNATLSVVGNSLGVATATSYAEATGIRVVAFPDRLATSYVIATGIEDVDTATVEKLRVHPVPLVWYSLANSTLRGGVRFAGAAFPAVEIARSSEETFDHIGIQHEIAACDAVGTAACLILGWSAPADFEVSLA